jgi:hypothetical protein
MEPPAEAPRIRAYLEKTQGVSAFAVPKSDWGLLSLDSTQMVMIDVSSTPLKSLAKEACLLGVVATQSSTGGELVNVYRYDENDVLPVNVDQYQVWTDLASHPEIQDFVKAASTTLNPNLEQFLGENNLLVKMAAGPDHWLPAVPSSVAVVIGMSTDDPLVADA